MNLKSNEIRVGNWVTSAAVIHHKVMPTDILAAYQMEIAGRESGIEPIELTRDIFIKMGAVIETFDILQWANLTVKCQNKFTVEFTEGDKNGYYEVIIDSEAENEIRVRYVHEVQNWYFMFTGGLELDFQL